MVSELSSDAAWDWGCDVHDSIVWCLERCRLCHHFWGSYGSPSSQSSGCATDGSFPIGLTTTWPMLYCPATLPPSRSSERLTTSLWYSIFHRLSDMHCALRSRFQTGSGRGGLQAIVWDLKMWLYTLIYVCPLVPGLRMWLWPMRQLRTR